MGVHVPSAFLVGPFFFDHECVHVLHSWWLGLAYLPPKDRTRDPNHWAEMDVVNGHSGSLGASEVNQVDVLVRTVRHHR